MRISIVVLALCCAGCGITGPSDDLTGTWTARVLGPGTFEQYQMTIRQDDDTITGRACATSFNQLLYKDVPVTGGYPNLQFTVTASETQPCCSAIAGRAFKGKQDKTMDIVGSYGSIDLRFVRSETSVCP
jgi:hypothetical protein